MRGTDSRSRALAAFRKQASIGGEQETAFEQAFSTLAYAYLKDKAPRLLDYVVGFQLLDRNDDNTKAVGVFGYKVGDRWLCTPVFFLNGDLKGHELLWLKKEDAFVPLKENWVNYIISRKPHVLGKPSERSTIELGGLMTDLTRITRSPSVLKFGSDGRVALWARPFVASTRQLPGLDLSWADLRSVLSQDVRWLKAAFDWYQSYPLVKHGFDVFYGGPRLFESIARSFRDTHPGSLVTLARRPSSSQIKSAAAAGGSLIADPPPRPDPRSTGRLQVIRLEDAFAKSADTLISMTAGLSDGERMTLLHRRILVLDRRDPQDVSVAYEPHLRVNLVNPTETGVYELLERPGTFVPVFVAVHPHPVCSCAPKAVAVRLSDFRSHIASVPTSLWVKPDRSLDRSKFYEFWQSLPPAVETLAPGGVYLLVGDTGSCLGPLRVTEQLDDTLFQVSEAFLPSTLRQSGRELPSEHDESHPVVLRFHSRYGVRPRKLLGEWLVPATFRAITLRPAPSEAPDDTGTLLASCLCRHRTEPLPPPLEPGNLADLEAIWLQSTRAVKLSSVAGEVVVESPWGTRRCPSADDAVVHLVCDHGLRESAARSLVDRAVRHKTASCRVKYAEPVLSALAGGPSAPAIPAPAIGAEQIGWNSVQTQYPQELGLPIPELSAQQTNAVIYDPFYPPDYQAMRLAQEAARAGQKEIFDLGVLVGLLKTVRHDSMVDRYLGDLMKALDRLGRILFMFYWHHEEFEDRYGKQDLPELEDSLRNAFEILGDVCLFLKEKQVGDFMDLQGVGSPSVEQAARL